MFCLSNILDQEKRSKYEEFVHNHENKEYVYIGKNQYGNLLFFFSLTIQANAMGGRGGGGLHKKNWVTVWQQGGRQSQQ